MTETTFTQGEPVLVAIDVANARHEVLIAVPGKKRRRRLTVLNQLDDFNRLIATLADYGRPARVAFEGQTMGLTAITIVRWPAALGWRVSRQSWCLQLSWHAPAKP